MGEHGVSLENMGIHGEHGEHGKDGKHQPADSKVTRRLLKEKSKLTFVEVLIKMFIACLLKGRIQLDDL